MSDEKVRRGISLNPDDFVQGGLVDDVDAVLRTVRFCEYDYNGKTDKILALHVNLLTSAGDEYDQYYSAGDLKLYAPSPDGKYAVAVGGTGQLKISSNAGQFITSVVNAGFSKTKLSDGDVSLLDGMGAHLTRVAQPERKGLAKPKDGEERDKTVLAVHKILWLPGEKPTFVVGAGASVSKGAPPTANRAVGAPTPAATTSAPTAASSGGDIDDKSIGYVLQVLSENGGSFQKSGLPSALFKLCSAQKDPDQGKILSTTFNPSWITASERPWKVSAEGVISLG